MTVRLTHLADLDLNEIWIYNAKRYGVEHADKYQEFLTDEIEKLAAYPERGKVVTSHPYLRSILIQWRAGGHAHTAYYETSTDAIHIVRVLHTAMNAQDHLPRG